MTSNSTLPRWAVAQMTGTSSVEANLAQAEERIAQASAMGCQLVALPENATFMGVETEKPKHAETLDGPSIARLASAAKRHGLFVLVGSMIECSEDPVRPHNTSVLIKPDGEIGCFYRKIHLFDVEVAGDRSYRESDFVSAGKPEPVVATVGDVCVGLSICYDLRFPWLYSGLRKAGAVALFIPAAFTVPTGRDHWETLLRARAIETQSYVLAPAQFGTHDTGRQTYGRSLIIDPWGTTVAQVPDGGGVACAEIDESRVRSLRTRMPMNTKEPAI